MTENERIKSAHHEADIHEGMSFSKIWIIPLLALLIGLWMVFQQWRDQGPLVSISFKSAAGLEAGKTTIKTRDVEVGEIEAITLQEDSEGVLVLARMNKETEHLLGKDSQFWIVTPRITHSGISGLNTLLSGSYIELVPGSDKSMIAEFIGLEEPPVTAAGTPGLHITLNSADQFAYSAGDPVIYKGLTVGQFEDVYFNLEEQVVYYNVFVKSPYHELITTNTRFWNVGGVRMELTAKRISVETGNLQSLLTQSVTFGVPEGMPRGEVIKERSYYDIYSDRESAATPIYKHRVDYVMLVNSSVRGLSVGAPVEYRGISIGEVRAINYPTPEQYNLIGNDYRIPVLISIEPGKIGMTDSEASIVDVLKHNEQWIQNGLRASLQSGNLLTGQLIVELQYYENAVPFEAEDYMGYPVIPITLDDFSLITRQAGQFLDKLNQLPLETIATNADALLLEMRGVTKALVKVGGDINTLLSDVNQQELVRQFNSMVTSLDTLASDYSAGSAGYEEIIGTMETLNRRLKEMQPLLHQLNQQPNSLIFGGRVESDLQPKAVKEGEQ